MEKERERIDAVKDVSGEAEPMSRREFFAGLGKWSKIVLGAVIAGGALLSIEREAEAYGGAWVNRGGGGWANRYGGGGAWANHGGSTGWVNRYGGGGTGWVNRYGGGGTGWVNRYGGGGTGWVNRY